MVKFYSGHRWLGDRAPMTVLEQLRDTTTIPGGPWTELWAPMGLRYHALHHLFPAMPYHSLGVAHRRLIRELPPDSPYHATIRPSLFAVLSELVQSARARGRQVGFRRIEAPRSAAEDTRMTDIVRLEQHCGRPLAVVRRRAASHELSKVVPDACGTVWNVIRSQKVSGAGRHVAVYLDCQINLEVGVELDGPFTGHGEVVVSATPSGLVATTTHFGPYQRLHEAHDAIRRWCAANGRKLAGPNWEVYGHWQDEWNTDPSTIRTDVFYLVDEAASATETSVEGWN